MDSNKRKSDSGVDETDSSEGKHTKISEEENFVNGNQHKTSADSADIYYLDQTQEYDLDDSDCFVVKSPSIHREKTKDYTCRESNGGANGLVSNRDDKKSEPAPQASSSSGATNNEEDKPPGMARIQSVQNDVEIISSIIPAVDTDNLYEKVLKHRADKNRVDIVTNEVLENGLNGNAGSSSTSVSESSSDRIFQDVAEVLVQCPAADPNKVYEMLEKLEGVDDRVTSVLNQLSKDNLISSSTSDTNSSSQSKSSSSSDPFSDPAFKNNPLYKDLKTLKKVLPDKDPGELYAYLEAHFDKGNRVQIVIEEFTKSDSQESLPLDVAGSLEDLSKGKQPATIVDKVHNDLQELKNIFPDCDPDFLYAKLESFKDDPERVRKIAAALFESKQYPKLKERLAIEEKQELKRRIQRMAFNMKDFLQKFPDPFKFFGDGERQLGKNYQDHTVAYLKNTYPFLKDGFIKKVLADSKQHLTQAVELIDRAHLEPSGRASKKMRATPRQEVLEYPEVPDEMFFLEMLFCQNKHKIKEYLDQKKLLRDLKVSEARDKGELFECGCCYDDECLFEEMGACADGHIFCKECIIRSSDAAVGEGKTKFPCLTGTCEQQFPLSTLQELLPAKTFSLALRKMQEEELQQAAIADLVSCPFCSFATIMPDPGDKVFKCLNPDCLKDSCRLCKEPNHVPLRCNEVEKQGETNMRTYIETKMSEAMLRTCPRCKKRFVKEYGCNKMTCTCGTTMCYVCREANINYDHFNQGKCAIDSDLLTLHKDEMLKAAEEARQEFLRDHPEQDKDMKYDPVKLIEKLKTRQDAGFGGENDGEEDYSEEDEDYDDDGDDYY